MVRGLRKPGDLLARSDLCHLHDGREEAEASDAAPATRERSSPAGPLMDRQATDGRLSEETQDPEGQSTGREHRADHPADEAGLEVRNLGTNAGDLRREPRVEVRDLRREPRVEGSDLRPHLGDLRSDLGEAGLELIGRYVIALLGGQTDCVR